MSSASDRKDSQSLAVHRATRSMAALHTWYRLKTVTSMNMNISTSTVCRTKPATHSCATLLRLRLPLLLSLHAMSRERRTKLPRWLIHQAKAIARTTTAPPLQPPRLRQRNPRPVTQPQEDTTPPTGVEERVQQSC